MEFAAVLQRIMPSQFNFSHNSQQLAENQSQIHIFDPEFIAGW